MSGHGRESEFFLLMTERSMPGISKSGWSILRVVSGTFSLKLGEGMSAWCGRVHYIRFLLFLPSKDSMISGFFKARKRAKRGVVGNSGVLDSRFNLVAD